MVPLPPAPLFDDSAIAAVIELAAAQLADAASTQRVVVLIAWPTPATQIERSHSGWCELGRLSDPAGRFWWLIRWHPERGEGRLIRSFARSPRGALGEIAPPD